MDCGKSKGKSKKISEEGSQMGSEKDDDLARYHQWNPVFDEVSLPNRRQRRSPDFPQPPPHSGFVFPFAIDDSQPLETSVLFRPPPPPSQIQQQMISFSPRSFHFPPYFAGEAAQLQQQQMLQCWGDAMNLSPRGRMAMINRLEQNARSLRQRHWGVNSDG